MKKIIFLFCSFFLIVSVCHADFRCLMTYSQTYKGWLADFSEGQDILVRDVDANDTFDKNDEIYISKGDGIFEKAGTLFEPFVWDGRIYTVRNARKDNDEFFEIPQYLSLIIKHGVNPYDVNHDGQINEDDIKAIERILDK